MLPGNRSFKEKLKSLPLAVIEEKSLEEEDEELEEKSEEESEDESEDESEEESEDESFNEAFVEVSEGEEKEEKEELIKEGKEELIKEEKEELIKEEKEENKFSTTLSEREIRHAILKRHDPTVHNSISDKSYYFLHNHEDVLEQEFYFKDKTATKQYYIALYIVCNNSPNEPYLTYLQAFSKDKYCFPSFQYSPIKKNSYLIRTISDSESDSESDGESDLEKDDEQEKMILNRCFLQLCEIFDFHPPDYPEQKLLTLFKDSYKGQLWDEDLKTGLLVIDGQYIIKLMQSTKIYLSQLWKDTYTFGLLHELTVSHTINKTPIDPIVTRYLKENESLLYILDETGERTNAPSVLYSYGSQKGNWNQNNVFPSSSTLLPPQSTHPIFGRMYYFSNQFETEEPVRYVVFLKDTFFADKGDLSTFNNLKEKEDENDYLSVHFSEKNVLIWGVSSSGFFREF